MSLSKSIRLGISLFAMTASLTAFASSASAKPLIQWTSVRQVSNGKHQGYVTSTFVQPDPSFSGSIVNSDLVVSNIASFTNTANQNVAPSGLTGLNIPAFGQGLFPATGQLFTLEAFYSTPSSSTSSADDSLFFVVQTADGLYHQASFAAEPSKNQGVFNGRTNWTQFFHDGNNFSPALGNGAAGRIRKEAIVFTGGPASGFDSINEILPAAINNTTFGFYFISGSGGYITNNPTDPLTKANFSVNTHPDSRFNFEF